jgi:hypothetical protein
MAASAHAIELKISADALERTLKQQLFNTPDGRYYLRGDGASACYVYAEKPHVSFKDDRIIVSVHTRSRVGAGLRGACIGVGLTTDADVSMLPEAEGETIGFRDTHIDQLSTSKELGFLLVPFLSRKLPQNMKVNAADLLRQALTKSGTSTGYLLALEKLKIHSMLIEQGALVVDVDGALTVK